jgi:hypothetical protein
VRAGPGAVAASASSGSLVDPAEVLNDAELLLEYAVDKNDWVPDDRVLGCQRCSEAFTLANRKASTGLVAVAQRA